jgi:endonuclease/exonuclease/phosphatase family metal-dependent hydrolase
LHTLPARPDPVRIATFNIEHLGLPGEGCVPRTAGQIAAIRDYVRVLDADIVSFQEVASQAAAEAVFPPRDWQVFTSQRVYDRPQPQCRQDASRTMGHMRTGFAVRRNLRAERLPELKALGDTAYGPNEEPFGVDVSVRLNDERFRILSVHLTSGCSPTSQASSPSCVALFSQAPALRGWVEARNQRAETWLIAGDFNRAWRTDDPFWQAALGQASSVAVVSREAASGDLIVMRRSRADVELTPAALSTSAIALDLSDHEPVLAVYSESSHFKR